MSKTDQLIDDIFGGDAYSKGRLTKEKQDLLKKYNDEVKEQERVLGRELTDNEIGDIMEHMDGVEEIFQQMDVFMDEFHILNKKFSNKQ